jgi:hypothetical protein
MTTFRQRPLIDIDKLERNDRIRFFILENWRVPDSELIALYQLTNRAVRFRKDGSVRNDAQFRLAALVMSIESFGGICTAGPAEIARRAHSVERTIQRALLDAELLGILHRTDRPGTTPIRTINWNRLFDWSPIPPFLDFERGDRDTPPGVTGTPIRGDREAPACHPKHTITPLKPNAETKSHEVMGSKDLTRKAKAGDRLGGWRTVPKITRDHLRSPDVIGKLFDEAVLKGWLQRSDMLRLRFFTLAAYCVRKSHPQAEGRRVESPGAVFTQSVKDLDWKGSIADELTALQMLNPSETLPRTSDLGTPSISLEHQAEERQRQLARLGFGGK